MKCIKCGGKLNESDKFCPSRDNGKLYGDVNPNVSDKCSYLTPVPGGVGPMTVVMLLKNTFIAYKSQHGVKDV